jgi:bifunctional non-homologous end joining protein LigD
MIWDKGTDQSKSPLPVDEQLTRGKIDVTLDGHKLRGGFTLLKTGPRAPTDRRANWLLIKHRDEHADPKWNVEAEALGRSFVSGLTLKEIAERVRKSR